MDWNDVTIDQYYQLMRAEEAYKSNHRAQIIAKVAILSGIKFEDMKKMTVKQFGKIAVKYKFLDEPMPEVPIEEVRTWDKYTFVSDMRKINTGQMVDLLSVLEGEPKEVYHDLLATMAVVEDDDSTAYEQRAKDIRQRMPIVLALPHVGFFLLLLARLETTSLRYLRMIVRVQMWKIRRDMARSISGLPRWRQLLQLPGKLLTRSKRKTPSGS